jgi:hypothetical protein
LLPVLAVKKKQPAVLMLKCSCVGGKEKQSILLQFYWRQETQQPSGAKKGRALPGKKTPAAVLGQKNTRVT